MPVETAAERFWKHPAIWFALSVVFQIITGVFSGWYTAVVKAEQQAHLHLDPVSAFLAALPAPVFILGMVLLVALVSWLAYSLLLRAYRKNEPRLVPAGEHEVRYALEVTQLALKESQGREAQAQLDQVKAEQERDAAIERAKKAERTLAEADNRVIGRVVRFENLDVAAAPWLHSHSQSGIPQFFDDFVKGGVVHVGLLQLKALGREAVASNWRFSVRHKGGNAAQCNPRDDEWPAPTTFPQSVTYVHLCDVTNMLLEKDRTYNVLLYIGIRSGGTTSPLDLDSFEATFADGQGHDVVCVTKGAAMKKETGKEQMQRFENLLQRLFTVAKDDVDKAEEMANEIEEVIERHEGEPEPDE